MKHVDWTLFPGEIDDRTLHLMNTPRCGVKDNPDDPMKRRRKRYALGGWYQYQVEVVVVIIVLLG